jgi:hypothetical protein
MPELPNCSCQPFSSAGLRAPGPGWYATAPSRQEQAKPHCHEGSCGCGGLWQPQVKEAPSILARVWLWWPLLHIMRRCGEWQQATMDVW